MKERPVLIIAAMENAELNLIKEKLENSKRIESKICTFIEGNLYGKEVILCASNIGIINAATSLTLSIEKYNPQIIINEGLAGGYGENMHSGDVVIGIDAVNITSYETERKKLNEGIFEKHELVSFTIGEKNHLTPQKADEKLVIHAKKICENMDNSKVHFGRIGSGDVWNKEADKIMYLYNKYNVLCEDMETISMYTVANKYNIPCISIRGISNNEMLDEEYDNTMGKQVQEFVCRFLSKYFD